jgi:excisionase family DNA binding protein
MTAMATEPKLYSPQEAADKLGVSLSRVHQFCRNGRLGTKVGGIYVITDEQLKRFSKQPRDPGRPRQEDAA